jgi:membrane protein YqaA with SNARE-associated domain
MNGRMRPFKPGAGVLASRGATIVPVGVAGTGDVLPKRGRLPRRGPVSVVFGEPLRTSPDVPAPAAERLGRRVSRLRAAARMILPAPRPSWFARVRGFALSPNAGWFVFGWGMAEALVWPIVPDVPVALLAVAAPSRFLVLAGAATAGSLGGGAVAYGLGAAGIGCGIGAHAPLVTGRMHAHALSELIAGGAGSLLGQPWSGVPYKVFALQAPTAGVGFGAFLAMSAIGRGHRILLVAAAFAGVAGPLRAVAARWVERLYAPFAVVLCAVFTIGLARVVAAWG